MPKYVAKEAYCNHFHKPLKNVWNIVREIWLDISKCHWQNMLIPTAILNMLCNDAARKSEKKSKLLLITASKSCIFFSWNDNGLALKQPAGGKLTWWKFEQRAPLATHHRGEPRAAYCRHRIGCVLRGSREVRCVASRMRSSHCQTFNIFSRTQATNRLFHFMSPWIS